MKVAKLDDERKLAALEIRNLARQLQQAKRPREVLAISSEIERQSKRLEAPEGSK